MAIDEGQGFTQPRSGPKAFTEYTFGALLVLVGLVGSFLATISLVSVYAVFMAFAALVPGFNVLLGTGITALLMIPVCILQPYYAWKLHTQNFNDFQRVIFISGLIIVLSVMSAALSGFFFLFTLQITLGQILLNVLAIFFLLKPEIQAEFSWNTQGN